MLKTHIKVFDISIKISLLSIVYQFVAHLIISNLMPVHFENMTRILISVCIYKPNKKKRSNRVHLCA